MPFDPAQPAYKSSLTSAVMRSQLTSLKALIDAISSITAAQIDGVTTLPPGDPAAATVTVTGDTLHFTFALPRGSDGDAGSVGPPGPPFANVAVDGVTTLPAGDPATVSVSFNGTTVGFSFGIPEGQSGPPGEVTAAQLAAEIVTTALNPNAVNPLSEPADTGYQQTQMQAVMDKLNELLAALQRV